MVLLRCKRAIPPLSLDKVGSVHENGGKRWRAIHSYYTLKRPGRLAQSVGHLTRKSGNILSCLLLLFLRRAVVSYWRKYVHEVLVNRLGGLSLPRKSVVRLTDRPDMTLDVYRGRKTTIQPTNQTTDISK